MQSRTIAGEGPKVPYVGGTAPVPVVPYTRN